MARSRSRAEVGRAEAPARQPGARERGIGRQLLGTVAALTIAAGGGDAARDRIDAWVDATMLPSLAVPTGTEVLARDGSLLRAFQVGDGIWRLAPPSGGVDAGFQAMLLQWEDRRFRQHRGVDPRAILRAAAQSVWHGRIVSGASTLSMQTARLLERGPTGDWKGKLRQARVALALERKLSKDQILDLYLRLAPYGGNVEGVRAASLMWFGKEPRRLTPAEAALLVALPQSPEVRRPDRPAGLRAATVARNRVLARARAAGLIDAEAEATALATPLPDRRRAFPALAPLLAERLHRESPGAPRIETTIDPDLQRAAEVAVARAVRGHIDHVSAAALIADHRTGEILASVGTAAWSDQPSAGFIDMTRVLRSPGSALKPFVYALAFDDGLIHPETLIEDRPATFGRWQPVNFDRQFRGTVTIRAALTESLNIPVVRVAAALGPARIAAVLRQSGMRLVYAGGVPGLAVVLGGTGVSLQDLVQGYAALGNGGVAVPLHDRPESRVPRSGGAAGAAGAGLAAARGPGPGGSGRGELTMGRLAAGKSGLDRSAAAGARSAPDGGAAEVSVPAADLGAHVAEGGAAGALPAISGAVAASRDGQPDLGTPTGARIIGPVGAWYVTAILAQIPPPTGAEAGRIAYKTGTSYGHRDALAVGYDGRFVAGVWLGRPDGTPVPGAFGGEVAAPLLFDLFDALGPRTVPLPPPPADALTLPNSRLPATLRRFVAPGEVTTAPARTSGTAVPGTDRAPVEALSILFPPEGAELELMPEAALAARLRGGTPPYVWLLNGAPVARTGRGEAVALPRPGPGYASLAVVDAAGRSQRVGFSVTEIGR